MELNPQLIATVACAIGLALWYGGTLVEDDDRNAYITIAAVVFLVFGCAIFLVQFLRYSTGFVPHLPVLDWSLPWPR